MTTLADRLKRARVAAGIVSATQAAEKFGWNPNTYRSIEGGTRKPSSANAIEFADALEVRLDWLLTGRGSMREGQQRHVPIFSLQNIVGRIDPSRRRITTEGAEGFITVPEAWSVSRRTFAVVVADDSLIERPASAQSLYPGDTVIADPELEPYPGCIVVALTAVGGGLGAVVRRLLMPKPNSFVLAPFNGAYPEILIKRKAIAGVMVGMYRRPPRRP